MRIEGDYIVFECSGKREYSNCGIVGIDADATFRFEPAHTEGAYHGYDGGFDYKLTPEEAVELAENMIARWTEFKAVAEKRRTAGSEE